VAVARSRPLLVGLRALGLGDLLTGAPALRALAAAFPEHERVLAAPAGLAPLARLIGDGGRPVLDRVVDARPLAPLARELQGAEVAVNLHGRGPHSHGVLLGARPRRVIWFENPEVPASRGAPRWYADEHEVSRWCRLLEEHEIAADPRRLELNPPPGPPPPGVSGATVVHPGAASAARRWPPERFAAVARAEQERGRAVVVTGHPGERPLASAVAAAAGLPDEAVLAGRTDLLELARVVAAGGRLVCGDTGVAHLATALGTPSVVLFGPTPPSLWGPPEGDPRHRALWTGRRGDPHAGRPAPGLLEIGPAEVIAALDALPAREDGYRSGVTTRTSAVSAEAVSATPSSSTRKKKARA
jgi:ADP-heptose:LPS heptosyltransferase